MKPFPEFDFPISVRLQVWEEEAHVAALYDGIFLVTLNFTITVMFVPDYSKAGCVDWPVDLPENTDEIKTTTEARLLTIALSEYTVTPNSTLAGTEQQIERLAGRFGTLFYVEPEEFENFSIELSRLAQEKPAVHDGFKVSEIAQLSVVQFLLAKVIGSRHFSAAHSQMLGR